jgi:hypothetical protein
VHKPFGSKSARSQHSSQPQSQLQSQLRSQLQSQLRWAATLALAVGVVATARPAGAEAVPLALHATLGVGVLSSIDGAIAVGGRFTVGHPVEIGIGGERLFGGSGRATDLHGDVGYAIPVRAGLGLAPFVGVGVRLYEITFDDVGYGGLVTGCTGVTGSATLPYVSAGLRLRKSRASFGLSWELGASLSYELGTAHARSSGDYCSGTVVGGQGYQVLQKDLGGLGAFLHVGVGFGQGS